MYLEKFSLESSIPNREKICRMIHVSVRPANSIPAKDPETPKTSSSAAWSAFIPAPPEWSNVPSMSQRISIFCILDETKDPCRRLFLLYAQRYPCSNKSHRILPLP